MDHDWQTEVAALTHMGVSALCGKYAELFGEPTRTGNKTWLVRRIAWPLSFKTRTAASRALSFLAGSVIAGDLGCLAAAVFLVEALVFFLPAMMCLLKR